VLARLRSNIATKQGRRRDDIPLGMKNGDSMAKILTWRDDWTLRIDTLDDDHRGIANLLVEIARRFADGPEAPSVPGDSAAEGDLCEALGRLGAFTRRYFQTFLLWFYRQPWCRVGRTP